MIFYNAALNIYNNSFENPIITAEKTHQKGWSIYPQESPSSWTEQKISNLLKLKR
jgi:hypothetical protein